MTFFLGDDLLIATQSEQQKPMAEEQRDPTSLIKRLGDPNGFADEFAKIRPFIRRRVVSRLDKRVLSRLDPSDILQETFILARSRLTSFIRARPMPFRNWIRLLSKQLVIAAHRRHLRSKKRTVKRESIDTKSAVQRDKIPGSTLQPEQQLESREQEDVLRKMISKLSPADQQIIILRDIEEKSNLEAAEHLGITPVAASKRHSRALDRLQQMVARGQEGSHD